MGVQAHSQAPHLCGIALQGAVSKANLKFLLLAEQAPFGDGEAVPFQNGSSLGRPAGPQSLTVDGQLPAPRSPKSISSSVVAEPTDASSIPDNISADGGSSVRSVGRRYCQMAILQDSAVHALHVCAGGKFTEGHCASIRREKGPFSSLPFLQNA